MRWYCKNAKKLRARTAKMTMLPRSCVRTVPQSRLSRVDVPKMKLARSPPKLTRPLKKSTKRLMMAEKELMRKANVFSTRCPAVWKKDQMTSKMDWKRWVKDSTMPDILRN